MNERAIWSPSPSGSESGVSVYSQEDEKHVGWAALREPGVVRVAFDDKESPVLRLGAEADLVFTGTGDIRLFVPRATVTRCEHMHGRTVYAFDVRDSQWENIRESLSPRRSIRVRPDEPIAIEMPAPSGTLGGFVEDLSESGVSLSLPREAEDELLRDGPHPLRFTLPGETEPIELMARLRYRAVLDEQHLRCGFEFDSQISTDYRRQRWSISRYVWSLQEGASEAGDSTESIETPETPED